jgi:hypothetical protein
MSVRVRVSEWESESSRSGRKRIDSCETQPSPAQPRRGLAVDLWAPPDPVGTSAAALELRGTELACAFPFLLALYKYFI